jgi:hypothetical protein
MGGEGAESGGGSWSFRDHGPYLVPLDDRPDARPGFGLPPLIHHRRMPEVVDRPSLRQRRLGCLPGGVQSVILWMGGPESGEACLVDLDALDGVIATDAALQGIVLRSGYRDGGLGEGVDNRVAVMVEEHVERTGSTLPIRISARAEHVFEDVRHDSKGIPRAQGFPVSDGVVSHETDTVSHRGRRGTNGYGASHLPRVLRLQPQEWA